MFEMLKVVHLQQSPGELSGYCTVCILSPRTGRGVGLLRGLLFYISGFSLV